MDPKGTPRKGGLFFLDVIPYDREKNPAGVKNVKGKQGVVGKGKKRISV
jgi:hypothetical protein